ncbi:glyoxylase-like metal-dependent hydrolase (beta-lactamase superfamily II) [Hoeflea marina]|uniref:Glyoxylase-like metal-dependent hydrolase (Beta-lactamase superfamily II) n=1 Tax=Hoeflea marina TaxID=274592 RepID=A0A317PHY5_9HYPH|nr:MBL fold metallo-hydrolase [Hoeflea marina]PWV98817.1 glyoxylase-like metal-dependent hydrolase (beta-lactamase superfamily II) [Hoeflea marina]
MIYTRTIGDVRLTNLVEYFAPTHDPVALYPDFDPSVIDLNRSWLSNAHWYENLQRLVVAIQIWIVHVDDKVILVDTGVGNFKPRAAARMNMLNSLVPQWLAAADASFEQVTHVVMTHLHGDHVGWNTVPGSEGWVPAFPNAQYFIPRRDFDYFKALHETNPAADPSFGDSVLPVVAAGLARFVEPGDVVAGCLTAESAAGHTPGQMNYWLRRKDEQAVFCADLFHHPLQITNPDLNTAFCVLPETARETRLAFLERVADTGTLILPCHFGPPHCGYVNRTDNGFAFQPSEPDLPQFN